MQIIKEKLDIDGVLEKRIKNTLGFLNIKSKIIKGNIIHIPKTNLAYIEPHKILINNITYLFFNEYNDIYINTLENSIPFNELETHIKTNKTKPIDIKIKKWADTCMEFVYNDLGYKKEQILHATLHMDEKTPHIHCVVVPLVRKFDKRTNTEKWTISKKQFIKDKTHLSELQDKYYQRLIDNGFDIERGIKNSDNKHISIKEFKKITKKLDSRLEKQNYLMTRDYELLEEKLKTSKPTITGKEVKIDKDTYDTLNDFMNTSKRVIKDMPRNQTLFKELTDYTKSYKDLENEKRNIQVEVRKLEYQNEKLQQENNRLHNFLHSTLQALKKFFHRLLKIGTEKDKDDVVSEIKEYHKQDLYNNFDLHDIVNNTSKEQEINEYLYTKEYEDNDKDFDI